MFAQITDKDVFSTSVEVFLVMCPGLLWWAESSPRPWRCFSAGTSQGAMAKVFSTSVEVFLCAPR